jgi:hypothetical protein
MTSNGTDKINWESDLFPNRVDNDLKYLCYRN